MVDPSMRIAQLKGTHYNASGNWGMTTTEIGGLYMHNFSPLIFIWLGKDNSSKQFKVSAWAIAFFFCKTATAGQRVRIAVQSLQMTILSTAFTKILCKTGIWYLSDCGSLVTLGGRKGLTCGSSHP
jgi:hypothetical protein